MDDSLLEVISGITEFNEISKFLQDPDVDEALYHLTRWAAREHVKIDGLALHIARLQAISGKLSMKAKFYTVYEKGPESSKKKNTFYTLSDALDKLCNSLKYMLR